MLNEERRMMNVDDEIAMCVCVCVCVVGRLLACVLVLVVAADLCRLVSHVGSGLQRFVLQHTVAPRRSSACIPFTVAIAMANSHMNKRHMRAYGDELNEKIEFDKAGLEQLEADVKVVKDRIAATRQELRELFCRPLESDMPAIPGQPTLVVKKAKLAAMRSVGVQTD